MRISGVNKHSQKYINKVIFNHLNQQASHELRVLEWMCEQREKNDQQAFNLAYVKTFKDLFSNN